MSTLIYRSSKSSGSPPAWTLQIPEEEYHAASQTGKYVSSGMLREFRTCPAQYYALVTGKTTRLENDAFRIGSAAHKRILEGEHALLKTFTVGGPINERTGRSFGADTKTFAEWLKENGKQKRNVITASEKEEIDRMACSVFRHPEISRLMIDGWPERCLRVAMEGNNCQIKIDWLRNDLQVIELKTIEDIERFEHDARRFGYLHQLAFYHEAIRLACGEEVKMTAVVVEKKSPYRSGVWHFTRETLEPYREHNRLSLRSLNRCRKENYWPTGYEAPRTFPMSGIPPIWRN